MQRLTLSRTGGWSSTTPFLDSEFRSYLYLSVSSLAHLHILETDGIDYMNAGHRYDILEEIGCLWTPYPTVVSLVTLYVAPLVMAVITAIYGGL